MLKVDIDRQSTQPDIPPLKNLERWAQAAYLDSLAAEVALVIVDDDAIRELNLRYRTQDKTTNVLSFPAYLDPIDGVKHLGDIIICAPVIESEALAQNKSSNAHWAHMTIHGMLHLQEHDHETSDEARVMETREIEILKTLGFTNPYSISS